MSCRWRFGDDDGRRRNPQLRFVVEGVPQREGWNQGTGETTVRRTDAGLHLTVAQSDLRIGRGRLQLLQPNQRLVRHGHDVLGSEQGHSQLPRVYRPHGQRSVRCVHLLLVWCLDRFSNIYELIYPILLFKKIDFTL